MIDVGDVLEYHFELVKQRWQTGIEIFHEQFEDWKKSSEKQAKHKVIRTALYGDLVIESDEMLLLDSFYLQRLRDVAQLGMQHLVYPDGRHTRFDHSIGVLAVVKQMIDALRGKLNETDEKNLRYAALLHDIGHGPFSHTSEQIFEMYSIDDRIRGMGKYHENKGAQIILDTDEVGKHEHGFNSYGLSNALTCLGANPEVVAGLITGATGATPAGIVNGPLDADKFDYFRRDAFHTGYAAGAVDADFIIRNLSFPSVASKICIKEKAVPAVLRFLLSRPITYHATAFHPVVRMVNAMILAAVDLALDLVDSEQRTRLLLHLDMMDDRDLVTLLEGLALTEKAKSDGKAFCKLMQRIRFRRLPHTEKLRVGDALCEAFGHSSSPLDGLFREKAWRMGYRVGTNDEVSVIDMSFEVKERRKVMADLEAISVCCRENEQETQSLRDHLARIGGAATEIEELLYGAPLLFGRAVVAGEELRIREFQNHTTILRPTSERTADLGAAIEERYKTWLP